MLMLNRFYFLEEGDCPACPGGGPITVAHVFDGRPGQAVRLLQHHYSPMGNYPFCMVFRGSDPAALARQVLLLFFHPGYVLAEKGRPVFIEGPQDRLAELFRGQRLDIEVIDLANAKQLRAEGHDPEGDYYRYCLTSYSPDDVFLLSGGDWPGWMTGLERVDQELATNQAHFYRLATESRLARLRAAEQDREIGRLREERKTLQELMELSSKHDEVNYILKFYRNEYEILPLWYKRFGHLVKVIQGKRSFRSLFDKRAKKYKD